MKTASIVVLAVLAFWFSLLGAATCVKAHEAGSHPSLEGWAEQQIVTPEYGKRMGCANPEMRQGPSCYCCAYSEIIEDAEYKLSKDKVQVINGKEYPVDEWWYKLPGKTEWKLVPDDAVHWGEHAPNGQAVLFFLPGTTTPRCFFPPKTDL